MRTLFKLSIERFPNLSSAENEALECLDRGEEFVGGISHSSSLCPDYAVISAEFVRWLCSDSDAAAKLTPCGLRLQGVRIDGELKLDSLKIPFDISLRRSCLPFPLDLCHCSVGSLDLSDTVTAGIDAEGLVVGGAMRMSGDFRAEGLVNLSGASIKRDLSCSGGKFSNVIDYRDSRQGEHTCGDCKKSAFHPYSLVLARANIEGSLFLCNEFSANGGVQLGDATIGGNVICTKGRFSAKLIQPPPHPHPSGHRLACDSETEHHLACALNCEGTHIKGNLFMSRIEVRGETRLTGAVVDKDLDSAGGRYLNPGASAIHGDRMRVRGNAFFCDGFEVRGSVRLPRAEIGADISFFGALFADSSNDPKESPALFCEGIQVQGSMFLKKAKMRDGFINVSYSTIGGNFDCTDATLHGVDGWAIKGNGMTIHGSAFLSSSADAQFQAFGLVALTGSKLGVDLVCTDGHFSSDKAASLEEGTPCAIKADNMIICGKVDMCGKKFQATGVNLDDTNIDSFLNCKGGTFTAPPEKGNNECAISAGKLQVSGSIHFNDIDASGRIMLNDASIGRNLVCRNGKMSNDMGYTLQAMQLKVAGTVIMEKLQSNGEIRIDLASIGGRFDCTSATFLNHHEQRYALHANGIKVAGSVEFKEGFQADGTVSMQNSDIGRHFFWADIMEPDRTTLILDATKVGVLVDEEKSWPKRLQINYFIYDFLDDPKREGLNLRPESLEKRRKEWLGRLTDFRTQPYEHLAAVLKRNGYEEEAKEVLIEKNRKLANLPIQWSWGKSTPPKPEHQRQSPGDFIAWKLYGLLVGYGYKPTKALKYALVLILAGWLLFYLGFENELMAPAKSEASTNVNQVAKAGNTTSDSLHKSLTGGTVLYSLVYSFDTFVPIVNLQTKEYWLPTAYPNMQGNEDGWGVSLCIYRWVHIISGWVLTTFFIAALTGLVRK
jgi:hypothetical protein